MNCHRNEVYSNIPADMTISPIVQRQALAKSLSAIFNKMTIPNPFSYINWYQREAVANGSRPRLVVVEFTLMEARDFTLSKSGLLVYSSIHFKGIVLEDPRTCKFLVFPPKLKLCCQAVLIPLPKDTCPLIHASPAIQPEIHVIYAAVAVTGS